MDDSELRELERRYGVDASASSMSGAGSSGGIEGAAAKGKRHWRISFNAPVTLCFVAICFVVTLLGTMSASGLTLSFFATYLTSFFDPMFYLRLVTHMFGHSGWDHFAGNMAYILLLGPLLEEKYGGKTLVLVILLTGVVTGLVHALLMPTTALCGASGVCFAFILMSSVTNLREGDIPLTFILVFIVFVGQQVYLGLVADDNISNLSHIIGGLIGGICGFAMSSKLRKRRKGALG